MSVEARDIEEIERPTVKEAKRLKRRRRLIKFWVYFSLVGCVVCIVLVIILSGVVTNLATKQDTQTTDLDTPGKATAITAANKWIKQPNPPLTEGQVVSWDGGEKLPKPSKPQNGATEEEGDLYVHRLTLADKAGQIYDSTVQVFISDKSGAVTLGTPSLVPRLPDGKNPSSNVNPWPQYPSLGAPDPVRQAAKAWVEAYTSGDPNKLRLATGDPDSRHSYMPLVGATANNITVSSSAAKWGDAEPQAGKTPPSMLVRVSFTVDWKTKDPSATGSAPTITLDLLLDGTNTGSPRVVAWGGPGTGSSLVPYGNAVTGRTLETQAAQ